MSFSHSRVGIDREKLKALLPEYLAATGARAELGRGKLVVRCPLHDDHTPSFTATLKGEAWEWYCHPCAAGGSIFELHARRCGLALPKDFRAVSEAVARVLGITPGGFRPRWSKPKPIEFKHKAPALPSNATAGTPRDWTALAKLRTISVIAVATAAKLGTLRFGTVCGLPSWILTDDRLLCAEARRMDGQSFPSIGTLGERKAHTLRGSCKSWPVGLTVRGYDTAEFRTLLVVEGGPDYLAALHYSLKHDGNCLPIAFLGAGVRDLHPLANPYFHGRRVRLFPHLDNAGNTAALSWARLLRDAGATVEVFAFAGLRKAGGGFVKDLNDCTVIDPLQEPELLEVAS